MQCAALAAGKTRPVEEDACTFVAAGAQRGLVLEVVFFDVALLAETLFHELPVFGCEHFH